MKKIIWIGNPYFSDQLSECGWSNVYIKAASEYKIYSYKDLVDEAGFLPDVVVAADFSSPPFVLGIENFPCFTVFYSVDSHIHKWHPYYAQGFDACLVSLGDHLENFKGPYLNENNIWWSPPYAKEEDKPEPNQEKTWDALFVDNVNPEIMPKRVKFMEELKKRLPTFQIRKGDYSKLFSQAKILVNHAGAGDLNFRVFEALGCGGCLVTPRVGHGMDKLFIDGEHLVGYVPEDAGDAAYRIQFLLDHPDVAQHIREQGLNEVNKHHRASHRAWNLTQHLCDIAMNDYGSVVENRKKNAKKICSEFLAAPYLHWANELKDSNQKAALLAAATNKFGLNGI